MFEFSGAAPAGERPPADQPAVRRPAAGRQRPGLPRSTAARPPPLDGQRRGRGRPGQLAVRGQRRVRSGHPPGRDQAAARAPGGSPPGRRRPGRRHPRRRPGTARPRCPPSGAIGWLRRRLAGIDTGRPRAGGAGRRAGPAQRLDRRRGRLGLRHRLGRGRRGAGLRPGREPAGARHRGLLQHRRPGRPGRRRGAVASSPPAASRRPRRTWHAGDGLRQRVCGQGGRRVQRHADRQGRSRPRAWPGPSLVIAYATCIAHGFDMAGSMAHMRDAVRSGHWPLYRYHPDAERPFHLDSKSADDAAAQFAVSEPASRCWPAPLPRSSS